VSICVHSTVGVAKTTLEWVAICNLVLFVCAAHLHVYHNYNHFDGTVHPGEVVFSGDGDLWSTFLHNFMNVSPVCPKLSLHWFHCVEKSSLLLQGVPGPFPGESNPLWSELLRGEPHYSVVIGREHCVYYWDIVLWWCCGNWILMYTIRGYTCVRCNINQHGGGVALFISNKIEFNIIIAGPIIMSLNFCWFQYKTQTIRCTLD